MARPSNGYRNSAGQPIPGTTDITGRFKDYSGLMRWAFWCGKQGHAQLYDKSALDIGTCVHVMAEFSMRGQPDKDIEFYLTATLRDPEHQDKARTAFAAFLRWRSEFAVEAYKQEISLVSEALQFGGTLDAIATIRDGLGLVDFKTSKDAVVYPEHLIQLAAYGILWDETHPNEPLTAGYHLIVLPKDGSKPVHREFTREQLHPHRQQFWLFRKAYDFDAACNDPMLLKGVPVKPSKPKATKPAPKAPATPASIGELMRAYGLIREEARA
jgi:hypothetical protein